MEKTKSKTNPIVPKIYTPYGSNGLSYWDGFKKSILMKVIPRALLIAAFSVLIVGLTKYTDIKLGIKQNFITITAFVVSLLLAYRTNTAYDRYWEGRRLWSTMTTAIRNLARYFLVSVPHRGKIDDEKKIVFDLLKRFAYATRDYLREKYCKTDPTDPKTYTDYLDVVRILKRTPLEEGDNKENKLLTFRLKKRKALKGRNLITTDQIIQYNLPLDIALYLNYYISKNAEGSKDAASITQMYNNVNTLIECLTNLERVLRSPIPYAYAIHLFHTTWIFCLSLPFQLVGDLDWVTVPIVFLASLILLGVEEIADEIENPFGNDPNDLPIDSFCMLIEMELEFIKKHGLEHEDAKDRGYEEVNEHGDQEANKVKEGIMEYWWTDAKREVEKREVEKTKDPEILEKNQAKISAPKQEVDEIKSNHEKEVNQYGGDSNV